MAFPVSVLAQAASTSSEDVSDMVVGLFVIAILIAIYLIPTIVAFSRGHPNRWLIAVINIVFGGTGIGWLGSLVWAAQAIHRSTTGNHGGESGLNLFVNDPKTVRVEQAMPAVSNAPAAASTSIDDLSAQLRKLKKLHEDGLISDEEYETLKKPLLQAI